MKVSTPVAEDTDPLSDTQPAETKRAPRRRGADPYDTLLWRLQPRMEGRLSGAYLLGITGCESRAGVSTIASNLAIRAADNQVRPVLLIDANTAAPRIAKNFRLRKTLGLGDLLTGGCGLEDAIHASSVEGLDIMPLGSRGIIERGGLDQRVVDTVIESLRESYELVIFDLPAVDRLRHNLLVARRLDGVVMTVRNESTPASRLNEATEQLRADGVELVGAVLNRQRQYTPGWLRRWL
ncbi:CpsD/CapB family tyrosine-protein kinase [Botrimarina hoheduenensis]|uniref:Tyrosine-protein kinase YwqD n=1 Tax=Botrimarina hoheduenensis TaxID=2528000 RepID=A0A5C5WF71_9BACT|nr:CpsD/CapB family tyrosine-protein kinase [Botrimarina hoheduenensis]TWT48715.1 Tyrosine-protein kinase YwqD [Botrimarina hoheduenensis]